MCVFYGREKAWRFRMSMWWLVEKCLQKLRHINTKSTMEITLLVPNIHEVINDRGMF